MTDLSLAVCHGMATAALSCLPYGHDTLLLYSLFRSLFGEIMLSDFPKASWKQALPELALLPALSSSIGLKIRHVCLLMINTVFVCLRSELCDNRCPVERKS